VTELPKYVIVGRGRWAPRMSSILAGEGRTVAAFEHSRRASSEGETSYGERLRSSFKSSGAQIAWLCVPPGAHSPLMIQAAIEAGLHVVVEKPWLCTADETRRLEALAQAHGALLAIHYEYCLLEGIEAWRREWNAGTGLHFGGRMKVSRPDHIGLPTLDNLGSHLFSIHEYCVPNSVITEIDCAYNQPDGRGVWLDRQGARVAELDLLSNKEPIIQRFIARFESAIRGAGFPFDLQFALKVAERTALWREQA
jgi:Oxidoreductase family, NAD-binding Rossmann fold